MIKKAVENKPDESAFVDSLGWLCYKQGRFAEARAQLERAITLPGGTEPEVMQHLGDTLYRLGRISDALDRWNLALQMLPGADSPSISPHERKVREYLAKVLAQARGAQGANQQVSVSPTAVPEKPRAAGPTTAPATVPH
jgi:Flp pilus assembly protein TadD